MHLTKRPTVKPSEFVIQKMEVSLYKPTSEYQSVAQENLHKPTSQAMTQEMAGYPDKPTSMSTSQEMENQPHTPTPSL